MTRLIDDWIKDINGSMKAYEDELIEKTGLSLIKIASNASKTSVSDMVSLSKFERIAVIPMTSGEGIIGTFADSVAAIIKSLNFEVFVTQHTDVAGIYEASKRGACIIFLADDDRFIAMNLKLNTIADNNRATAAGFVAALEGAVGSILKNKDVLLTGCGLVGKEILDELRKKEANVTVYDIDENLLKELEKDGIRTIRDCSDMTKYKYVMDATSTGGWLKKDMLHPQALISAPGVPISLDAEAYGCYGDRAIHDYLPIGVAVMLAMACK